MHRTVRLSLALAFLSAAGLAAAQDDIGPRGWGPRAGMTLGPDQVHVGFHVAMGHFAEQIRLRPNVEIGLGGDRTVIALNADLDHRFDTMWGNWAPYAGGELGIQRTHRDRGLLEDTTNTDLTASAIAGLETFQSGGDVFFLEAKLGLADAPDLKLGAGWMFH